MQEISWKCLAIWGKLKYSMKSAIFSGLSLFLLVFYENWILFVGCYYDCHKLEWKSETSKVTAQIYGSTLSTWGWHLIVMQIFSIIEYKRVVFLLTPLIHPKLACKILNTVGILGRPNAFILYVILGLWLNWRITVQLDRLHSFRKVSWCLFLVI